MPKPTPDKPVAAKPPRRISVLERRLQNPFGESSKEIELTDPSLTTHWFNSGFKHDRIFTAKTELGWSGVRPDMIKDLDQVGAHTTSPEGYVARGARAEEVLMCMPRESFRLVQLAKTRKNNEDMRNPHGTRTSALEAFGKNNPDGAEAVQRMGGPVGGVTDSYERIEQVEPTEDA